MTQLQRRRGRAQQTLLNKDSAGLGSASAVLFLLGQGMPLCVVFFG